MNHVDLFRVKGGGQYADLLEAAGVDTRPSSQSGRRTTYKKMAELNEEKSRPPTALGKQVKGWIDQAKALPRKIKY